MPTSNGVADETSTPARILDAALVSFATRGYEATSLDAVAAGLEVRKQTILYWFPSKEVLLDAVIDRSAIELSEALEGSLATAGTGWVQVEAVVRSVFRLAARQPELLGLVREMGRLGPPAATRFVAALEPLVRRASEFLAAEMDSGHMRRHEPRLLLLAIYSTVIGMLTEVELLRALGEEPTARSLVRRRAEILDLLRSALVTNPT
jgi:AcrR family transcriptional regulator